MDITVRQLEIFRAVAVAGSITKASHRFGLSQPSISQQLAKLEDTLNAQMILRNRTGLVSMTPAGEFWFKSSGDLISRMGTMMKEHEQRFRTSNVVLRLGGHALDARALYGGGGLYRPGRAGLCEVRTDL